MDVLKNKSFKTFDYISRYSTVPYYYHKIDKKYFFGLGSQLQKDQTYVAHKVTDTDTLDSLALKYLGNPSFWWVIADFNSINDPYIKLINRFKIIKIPNLNSIQFGAERK